MCRKRVFIVPPAQFLGMMSRPSSKHFRSTPRDGGKTTTIVLSTSSFVTARRLDLPLFTHICESIGLGPQAVDLFAALDTDENEVVDALEFVATIAAVSGMSASEKILFLFKLYDFGECDGLSLDEITLLLKSTAIGLSKIEGVITMPTLSQFEQIALLMLPRGREDRQRLDKSEFLHYCAKNPIVSSWLAHYEDLGAQDRGNHSDLASSGGGPDFPSVEIPTSVTKMSKPDYSRKEIDQAVVQSEAKDDDVEIQPLPVDGGTNTCLQTLRPDARIALEWVYGYGAKGSRNNLSYTNSGDIAWHAGEIGIIYSPPTLEADSAPKQRFVMPHSSLILCLSTSSDGMLCATGDLGDWPKIVVWDNDGNTVAIFAGCHKRAIVNLAFSRDSKLLASLDAGEPSPTLAVHSLPRYDVAGLDGPIFATRLAPGTCIHDLAWSMQSGAFATVGKAIVQFWFADDETTPSYVPKRGILKGKSQQALNTHTTVVAVGKYDDAAMVSGSTDGSLLVWQGRNCVAEIESAHGSAAILAVHSSTDNVGSSLVLSAGANGKARLWRYLSDAGQLELSCEIDLFELGISGVVSAVCLHNSGTRCLIGTTQAEIYEIFLKEQFAEDGTSLVGKSVLGEGPIYCGLGGAEELTCVAACAAAKKFSVCGLNGSVTLWDMDSRALVKSDASLPSPAVAAVFSPDGTKIALGLRKGTLHVLEVPELLLVESIELSETLPIVDLKWSLKDVLCVAFGTTIQVIDMTWTKQATCVCPDSINAMDIAGEEQLVRASCDDGSLIGFDFTSGELIENSEQLKEANWETRTVNSAVDVQAIASSSNFSLKSKYASADGLVACADSVGSVHIFEYPCIEGRVLPVSVAGHAQSVTSFEFVGQSLLTVGGSVVLNWSIDHSENQSEDDGVIDEDAEDEELTQPPLYDAANDENLADDKIELDCAENLPLYNALRGGLPLDDDLYRDVSTSGGVPNDEIILEWIHGYSGQSQRNNVRYAETGAIVYPAACAACVLAKTPKRSQSRLVEHTDEISAMATWHDTVATVQKGTAPKVLVWSSSTMRVKCSLRLAHGSRAGSAATFSPCGRYLAIAGQDDDHELFIFEWAYSRLVSTTPTGPGKILSIAWGPDNTLLVGSVEGYAAWSDATCRNPNFKKGLFGKTTKTQSIFSTAFVATEGVITGVVGTAEGGVYSVDERMLNSGSKQHEGPVNVLWSCVPTSTLGDEDTIDMNAIALISGGYDGKIKLYTGNLQVMLEIDLRDTDKYQLVSASISSVCFNSDRRKLLVGTGGSEILELSTADELIINGGALVSGHCAGKLAALATHPVLPEIATAGDDMTLRTWDTSNFTQHRKLDLEDVSRAIAYSPNGHLIAVGLGSDLLPTPHTGHILIVSTLKVDLEVAKDLKLKQSTSSISVVAFSPNGELLAAASQDCKITIFDCLNTFVVKTVFETVREPVSAFDFSEDSSYLRTCSATGNETLVFNALKGNLGDANKAWSSWTTISGEPVAGAKPSLTSSPDDVSTAHRSPDLELLVTGDDFGSVKLFKWPCEGSIAQCKAFFGHTSRIAAVRFAADSEKLASIGLRDRCLFQWRRKRNGVHADILDDSQQVIEGPPDEYAGPAPAPSKPDGLQVASLMKLARLKHVYGVPGGRCCCLAYNAQNESVYALGRILVSHCSRTQKQQFFDDCTNDISCAAVSQDGSRGVVAESKSCLVRIFDTRTMASVGEVSTQLKSIAHLAVTKSFRIAAIGIGRLGAPTIECWTAKGGGNAAELLATAPVTLRVTNFLSLFEGEDSCFDVFSGGLGEFGAPSVLFWKLIDLNLVAFKVDADIQSTLMSGVCVDDGFAVTGAADGALELWEVEGETATRVARETTAHVGAVRCLARASSGRCVSAGPDGWVKLWSTKTLEVVAAFSLDIPIAAVAVDSIVSRVAAITTDAQYIEIVVDSGDMTVVHEGHPGALTAVALSSLRQLVATCDDQGFLKVWDIRRRTLLVAETNLRFQSRSMAWSPDGRSLAIGIGPVLPRDEEDGKVVVVALNAAGSLEEVASAHNAKASVTALRYSPDGTVLALGSDDHAIYLYAIESATSYKLYACFDQHAAPIASFDFSTNGKYLRSLSTTKSFHVCEVLGGDLVATETCKDELWASESCLAGQDKIESDPRLTTDDATLAKSAFVASCGGIRYDVVEDREVGTSNEEKKPGCGRKARKEFLTAGHSFLLHWEEEY